MDIELKKYQRVRNLREERGLTQKQVAEYLHVKQNTYSQYETETLNYPLDIVIQLAVLYDTSIDYLVGLTDEKLPYKRKPRR